MATQRVIPIHEDALPAQVININSNLASSPGAPIIAGSGQQSVTFVNGAGVPITITFVNNPVSGTVFGGPYNLDASGPNSTLTLTPPPALTGATANYNISTPTIVNQEPFAIQVGNGPMYITFKNGTTAVITNPDPVAIPIGGWLEFQPGDGNSYNGITWTNNLDPFNPPGITSADSTPYQEQLSAVAGYGYKVPKPISHPGEQTGSGGGTVKVKSS